MGCEYVSLPAVVVVVAAAAVGSSSSDGDVCSRDFGLENRIIRRVL